MCDHVELSSPLLGVSGGGDRDARVSHDRPQLAGREDLGGHVPAPVPGRSNLAAQVDRMRGQLRNRRAPIQLARDREASDPAAERPVRNEPGCEDLVRCDVQAGEEPVDEITAPAAGQRLDTTGGHVEPGGHGNGHLPHRPGRGWGCNPPAIPTRRVRRGGRGAQCHRVRPAPPPSTLAVAVNAGGELPLVAVRLRVPERATIADDDAVTATVDVHPAVAARFDRVMRNDRGRWLLPARGPKLDAAVAAILETAGTRVRWAGHHSAAPGRAALRRATATHTELVPLLDAGPSRRRLPGHVEISPRPDGRLTVRVTVGAETAEPLGFSTPRTGGRWTTTLPVAAAGDVIDGAVSASLPVYDATYPRWDELRRAASTTSVAIPVPGAPGLFRWQTPPRDGDGEQRISSGDGAGIHDAGVLWDLFDGEDRAGRRLAAHGSVLDAAESAGAPDVGWPGLRPHQDTFVARYLASRRGAVCAFPPGTGKTPTAAVALRESWQQTRHRNTVWRAVVAAPAGVVRQWHDELTTWFPAATIIDADATWPTTGPCVLVDTVDRIVSIAGALTDAATTDTRAADPWISDLVCDEATVVASAGKRARALWQLRAISGRGLALTGTPAHKGSLDSTAVISAWALGQRHLYANAGLSDPAAAGGRHWRDRLGVTFATCEPGDVVPPVHVRTDPEIPMSGAEAALVDAVDQVLATAWGRAVQLRDALLVGHGTGEARRSLRTETSRARLGVVTAARAARAVAADPSTAASALPAGVAKDPVVAARAEELLVSTGPSRRARIAQALVDTDADGILVFSDTLPAAHAFATELGAHGLRVGVADGSSAQRRDQIARSLRAGDLDAVVVSGAAAVGLNLQAANVLCHIDGFADAGSARQRHGRAARLDARASTIDSWAPPPGGFAGWLTRTVAGELAGSSTSGDHEEHAGILAAVAAWDAQR